MNSKAKKIFAIPRPDGNGYQVSYETGTSRKVHQLEKTTHASKKPPHGAGSFHDPEQHHTLMKHVEDYIKNTQS